MSPPGKRLTRTRRFWLTLGLACLLLGMAGLWTNHAVHETMEDLLAEGLQTVLDANLKALKIWLDNEQQLVAAWAADSEVRELTEQLLQFKELPAETLRQQPLLARLDEPLEGLLGENDLIGYAIVSADGLLLASDQRTYVGRQLSAPVMPWLEKVKAGATLIRRPFAKNRLVSDLPTDRIRPIMVSAAPIKNARGQFLAALVFSIDPEEDFSRILRVGRMGRSGNTYAFDKTGVMLSESRFDEQLKQLGLIANTPQSTSLLQLQLRDPGGDLTRGFKPQLPRDQQPLTRLAAAAASGQSGIDLDGYRDYRGVTVVGVWTWLDAYQFGIATEATRSEALSVLRPVRIAFWGLFALVLLIAAGLALASRIALKLQSRIEQIRQLGQYTLQEKIGEGGMGSVYKASHALLRRPTAIKLIREDQLDNEALQRFEHEVQATSQLSHPNTLAIYDYGHSPGGIFYYAMEYISGLDLGELVTLEGQLSAARTIHILRQVCGSLGEAHQRGILHRDIKPGNIMLCSRGGADDIVKVLDFGLVRKIDNTPTGNQLIHGTPEYIAPECLLSGRTVDARSDIYCLGAVAFFLLTGQPPFVPTADADLLHQVLHDPPPDPAVLSTAPLPTELGRLFLSCLSKDPEQRPASAHALQKALQNIALDQPWQQADADRWWQENRQAIQKLRYADRVAGRHAEPTIATDLPIDLGQRP